jgi:hypothetical protein
MTCLAMLWKVGGLIHNKPFSDVPIPYQKAVSSRQPAVIVSLLIEAITYNSTWVGG